jgi:hypothetical protein
LIEKARIFKVNNGKVAERGKKNGRRKSNNQL